jgi:phospholipid/cholesterol/gamma-HCH transport system permease protein
MIFAGHNQSNSECETTRQTGIQLLFPFFIIGNAVTNGIKNLGASFIFLFTPLMKVPRHGQLSKTIQQIYYIGARSTTIIILVGLFTGMVLGLQSYYALIKFGAQGALGTLVAFSLVRELVLFSLPS